MSRVDYYKCDRCGSEGNEKFAHWSCWGHHNQTVELCNHCSLLVMAAIRKAEVESK